MDTGVNQLRLEDGSTVAIIGGGPAGSFFALLALREAGRRGIRLRFVLFDGKKFLSEGPQGCNMCAGVVSWRLMCQLDQLGIRIPPERVQRLIRSYVFHTREGSHLVGAPPGRRPIPVVYRGNGPRFAGQQTKISFDNFLLEEALRRGAEIVPENVKALSLPSHPGERVEVKWNAGTLAADLAVVATGVGSFFSKQLAANGIGYRFPHCVRAFQAELDLGKKALEERLGDRIHVFSLGIKGIRFAALIPKTRFATVTLVGKEDLDNRHLGLFLRSPAVRRLLPDGWTLPGRYCSCRPRLPVKGGRGFYGDRLLFIGDASMSRYYKNGIDSAFQTAQFAVQAAFDHGLAANVFRRSYYALVKKEFVKENLYARVLFQLNDFVASRKIWVRAHLGIVQKRPSGGTAGTIHFLTWNLFTGDARYRDIFWASLRPRFFLKMILVGLHLRRP